MQIPEAVLAALKTKNLKAEQLKAWLFEGDDLFLHLAGGRVERVELSALPATVPLPEPETAKAVEAPEAPTKAQASSRPPKPPKKGGG